MSKQGGKLKPLKAPKSEKKDYDESDLAYLQKKKEEEKALKDLKSKATQKGQFGGSGQVTVIEVGYGGSILCSMGQF
ncbi:hypothetical protein V2J09_004647 [Rumex salicifolius]